MEIRIYDSFPQPEDKFSRLMDNASKLFAPPISEVVDIESYSHKLYTLASFVLCIEADEIKAFMAFYKNKKAGQLYVSLICVAADFQRQGLGRQMLDVLASLKSRSFSSIGLEVVKTNEKAYTFYKKYGFIEQEDRGEKRLMIKTI